MSSLRALLLEGAEPGQHSALTIALSYGGVAFAILQLVIGAQGNLFPIPGRDELIWDRVGDAVWSGAPVYYNAPQLTDSFVYAPPLAVVFAFVSWLPVVAQHVLFTALKVLSLRVIAGSWIGAGIACWFPLVAFDLGGGNFNLLVAAAIVAAVEGRPQAAVLTSLAKFAPLLAIHPHDRRPAVITLALALAITIPWLHLWPEWLNLMAMDLGRASELGPQVPVPWWLRLVEAVAILWYVRTGWARALAATLAIPAFYWASFVVLLAPVALFVRGRQADRRRPNKTPRTFVPALGAGRP